MTPAQQEALDAMARYGTQADAARALGISTSALQDRINRGRANLGAESDPAVKAAMQSLGMEDLNDDTWLKSKPNADGYSFSRLIRAPKREAEDAEDALARMAEAFANIPAAPRIDGPAEVVKGRLGLHVVADLHMGASIGEAEAGAAYSPEIAEDRLRGGFAQCHAAMPACEVCVILYNGDTTHANDDKDRTPKSGHILKVSRSHQANVFAVETVLAWQVDEALSKHGRVVVSIKKGNHDPNTPTPLIMGMRARYRDNPRVTVIDDEDPYFVIQMGRLFLCAHHGDGAAPSKRALSIPHKFRREWGVSDYHWYFSADKHHAKADTFGGLHWRQVPSVISLEQHSHGEGYADTSGMYAAWFDTETGRVSETEIRF